MESNASETSKPRQGYRSIFPSDADIRTFFDGIVGELDPQRREALDAYVIGIVKRARLFEAKNLVLLRQRFGSSTEALSAQQLPLFAPFDAKGGEQKPEQDQPAALTPQQILLLERSQELERLSLEAKEKELEARRLQKAKRRSLLVPAGVDDGNTALALAGLERRVHPAKAPDPCQKCGLVHEIIDVECSSQVVFVPGHFVVEVTERNVLAPCRGEDGKPTRDPLPDKLVDKGLYDWTAISQCLEWRYADQIPAHHISLMTERLGLKIPTSTLGDYFEAADELVQLLVELYKEVVLACEHVGLDDTRMLTLTSGKGGKPVKGRLWCYIGYDDLKPAFVFYTYTPDWKGERPRAVLQGRTESVQGDGYAGVDPDHHVELTFPMAGCHDHCRRKFETALRAGELAVAPALKLYQKLYEVERVARLQGLDTEGRLALRQRFSVLFLDEMARWVGGRRGSGKVGELEAKALTYFENQEAKLRLYLGDGRIPISNIAVERQIRPVARGRRLHLFAGSTAGGARMGNLYTVVQNVLLAGGRPYTFLLEVLPMLKRGASREELLAVLPLHPAARRALARQQSKPNSSHPQAA